MKILTVCLLLITLSCSSKHIIHINKDNSAKIEFTVNNKESLVETLKEWGVVQATDNNSIIDISLLKEEFAKNPYITDLNIKSINGSNYIGSFLVKDINKMFENEDNIIPEELRIFSSSDKNGNKTLKISLSMDNYKFLKKSLPILQQDSIDMLGPDANQDLSKEEYLDMISFSLGEEGPKDLEVSSLSLLISVDGNITNIVGGEIIDNSTAKFNIPLLDIILLKESIEYSISYK